MRNVVILILLIFFTNVLFSQTDTLFLNLEKTIKIANDSSLSAFKSSYAYQSSFWQYKNFQTSRLPMVSLSLSPFSYSRYLNKQFNISDTSYHYFEEQNLNSYAGLSVQQEILATGGTVFMNSSLNRLQNFNGLKQITFSSVPLVVGFQQPLSGFNPYKWERKIQRLKYDQAKLEYVQSHEKIALETIDLYFELLIAEQSLKVARTDKINSDTLYQIGKKRYEIMGISKSDLLQLRLEQLNSKNRYIQSLDKYHRANYQLINYLRLSANSFIATSGMDSCPLVSIDSELALTMAKNNSPVYKQMNIRILDAEQLMRKTKAESNLNSSLNVRFGLNQQSDVLSKAYEKPTNQFLMDVSIQIPLLDWGKKKGKYTLAKIQKENLLIAIEQEKADFEKNLYFLVQEFNTQIENLNRTKEAATISEEIYELNINEFLNGKVDVNTLNNLKSRKESAFLGYYSELQQFWYLYYQIRAITLYDFLKNTNLVFEDLK